PDAPTFRHPLPTSEPPLDGCPIGEGAGARFHARTHTDRRTEGSSTWLFAPADADRSPSGHRTNVEAPRTPGPGRAFACDGRLVQTASVRAPMDGLKSLRSN